MQQPLSPLWSSFDALPAPAAGVHRYLLINQAALKEQRALLSSLSKFECLPLFGQSDAACRDGATPFVLRLDPTTRIRPIIHELADAACYACALTQIDTQSDIQTLTEALTRRCEVLLPDGVPMLLRYFDTRVFMSLLDVLTPEQADSFLSCASDWWYSDREGAMVPAMGTVRTTGDAFSPPLVLSVTQEHAMIEASEPDAVIDLIASSGRHPLFDIPYPQRYPIVVDLVYRARQWGLEEIPDFAAFVTIALSTSNDFDVLPPWNELLPRVQAGELTFSAALDRVRNLEET